METVDLDLTASTYVQFTVKFYCWSDDIFAEESSNLLFLYSTNGGITWNLIQVPSINNLA